MLNAVLFIWVAIIRTVVTALGLFLTFLAHLLVFSRQIEDGQGDGDGDEHGETDGDGDDDPGIASLAALDAALLLVHLVVVVAERQGYDRLWARLDLLIEEEENEMKYILQKTFFASSC